ncbi:MAG: bifunctional 1-(5-phosphoribosyl)-5-((5-phosphoribosylamino)methylideneamino)imidazole-4-carboxamide isomerase/phosphoribosylanthranilate isomerase PriA [Actinomycetaceae bacterium]|nr:bifunctional 1-(5-phosphoribosyl)-5-((5-phosphoribosylamino)methylideneamino)imidazole-4-carboxamide isomerase/phosphoribosylanthranilate isomerase PriA [Actinomycetaceae bacterium]
MLELLPAIDVVNGQAVRLHQGKAGTETVYGKPLEVAREFAALGAKWIHVVDLDAAFGRGANTEVTHKIAQTTRINIELSGGIRDDESLAKALDAGARRVNLGTAAIENPEWTERVIKEFGDRIAVGLDVRGRTLATRGWTEEGGDLFDMIERLNRAGCERYVVTDVTKDGTLQGPNLDLLAEVCEHTDAHVVASGGISTLDDIRALLPLTEKGVEGVIVGKAIYSGAFTLEEALKVAAGE